MPRKIKMVKLNNKVYDTNSIKCINTHVRSRHRSCSMKKGILKTFEKFTGKYLYQSYFFNKVAGLRPATSLKKKFW